MTAVVNTTLMFLDSDSVVAESGIGQQFKVQVPSGQIKAGDGQFMRISLQNFSMLKNFYNLNKNNNAWVVTSKNNVGIGNEFICAVKPMDYATFYDIGISIVGSNGGTINNEGNPDTEILGNGGIAANLVAYLEAKHPVTNANWGLAPSNAAGILPKQNINSLSTSDKIFEAKLAAFDANNAKIAHGLTNGDLVIQCRNFNTTDPADYQKNFSDSYEIFGARRITDVNDLTTSSFQITITTDEIKIRGFYPMQRFTQEHLYMRSEDLAGTNFASHHFNTITSQDTLAVSSTPVFAKMPIGNQTVSYDANQHQDYFFDYFGDNLTNFSIAIRDCDGRAIPLVADSQTKQGNMNFTMVLRIDTIAYGGTGFDKLVGPMDNLMDISSGVRKALITQGKPAWRNIPGRPGLNGQFFPKQPPAPPQSGDHPNF